MLKSISLGAEREVVGEYLSKGSPIFIEGRLQFNQWETKDGQKRSTLRVVADNFNSLESLQNAPEEKLAHHPKRVNHPT